MSYIPIPTRTENDLNSSADINQLMANIDYLKERLENYPLENLYTIGERYIQLPEPDGTFSSAKSPEFKFGGEWACIFDEEGVFFKTEGHEPTQYYKADSAGTPTLTPYRNANGLAEDKIQYITGDLRIWGAAAGPSSSYGTGQVRFIQNTGNRYRSGVGGNAPLFTISPIYSPYNKSTSNLDGRTEPTNRLMRIWERVA